MLVRFVCENFLSFKEEVEFNMLTGQFKIHKDHIKSFKNIELLKSAAIYGANGSGKSNLIKAISYLRDLVLNEEIEESQTSNTFKIDESYRNKPTKFEIEFVARNKVYAYGIVLKRNKIEEEWLYEIKSKGDDSMIFTRTTTNKGKTKLDVISKYLKTDKDKLLISVYQDDLLETNETFLNKVKDKKFAEIREAYKWFAKELTIIYPWTKPQHLIAEFVFNDPFKKFTNELLCSFDTGVHELGIRTTPLNIFLGEENKELKKDLTEKISSQPDSVAFLSSNDDTEELVVVKEGDEVVVKQIISKHRVRDKIW